MPGRLKTVTLLLWFLVFASLPLSGGTRAYAKNLNQSTHKLFVRLKKHPSALSLLSVSGEVPGIRLLHGLPNSDTLVFSVSGDQASAEAQLKLNPEVSDVFPVHKIHAFKTTNDTFFTQQWSLTNMKVGGTGQTAWDILGDSGLANTANVKVAVIDTGITRDHPDISGKIDPSDWVSCDATGCARNDSGIDDNGHGTHVAGLIGANTNNSQGIAGVGWGVKLMAVKVLDASATGDMDVLLKGITWAADHGARIINLSLGVPQSTLTQQEIDLIQQSIDYAWNKNVFIVIAAGNCGDATHAASECQATDANGNPIGAQVNAKIYPAAANHVLSVAALGPDNRLASYSEHNDNTNGNWVAIAAPGGDTSGNCTPGTDSNKCIISTWTAGYALATGTSMSSPQVAGVAALLLAANPNLTNSQLMDVITQHANHAIASGVTNFGAVDALAAVSAVISIPTPTTGAPTATGTNNPTNTPAVATPTNAIPTSGIPTPTSDLSATPTVPVCDPNAFGPPTDCTAACGGGKQYRTNACGQMQVRDCNTQACPTETPAPTPTPIPPTMTPYPTTGIAVLPKTPPDPFPPAPYCAQTIIGRGGN